MPEIVSCPDCERKLRVPDNLIGKKVKCPGCGVMFTALVSGGGAIIKKEKPAEVEPIVESPRGRRVVEEEEDEEDVPRSRNRRRRDDDDEDDDDDRPRRRRRDEDDDEDDRPRRRARAEDDYDDEDDDRSRRRRREEEDWDVEDRPDPRRDRAGWRRFRTGIFLNVIGLWIWLGGMWFYVLMYLLAMLFAPNVMLQIGSIGFVLGYLGEQGLRTACCAMCMLPPARKGTAIRPLGITSLCLVGLQTLCFLVFVIMGLSQSSSPFGPGFRELGLFYTGPQYLETMLFGGDALFIIVFLLGIAAIVVFPLFARLVARSLKDKDLGKSFMATMIAYASWYGALFLLWLIMRIIVQNISS